MGVQPDNRLRYIGGTIHDLGESCLVSQFDAVTALTLRDCLEQACMPWNEMWPAWRILA